MTKKQKKPTTRKKNGKNLPSIGKKKKSRRESVVNPALNPKYNLKTRTDLIDQDYLHKLSPKELAWLNKFNEEEVNASFKKDNRKNLNKSKAEKKASYNRNNSRNRCILTRQKAAGRIQSIDDNTKVLMNPVENMNMAIDLRLLDLVDENGKLKKKP